MSENSKDAVGIQPITDSSLAERIKSKGLRKVMLPTIGEEITVRNITIMDLMGMGILPAGFLAQMVDDSKKATEDIQERIKKKVDEDPSFTADLVTMFVVRGVVDPPVVDCEPSAVPSGALHVNSFGDDLLWVFNYLLTTCGLMQEVGPRAHGFSDGAGSGDPRPDGEAVWDDAPGAPADEPS